MTSANILGALIYRRHWPGHSLSEHCPKIADWLAFCCDDHRPGPIVI